MWLARWSLLRFISQHPREPTYEHSRASFASMICGRTSLPVRIANRYKERNPVQIPSFRLHVVFKISLSHGWRTGGYSMLLSYCAVLLIMLNIQQGLTRWGSSQPYPPLKRLVCFTSHSEALWLRPCALTLRSRAPKVKEAQQSLGSLTVGPVGLCGESLGTY